MRSVFIALVGLMLACSDDNPTEMTPIVVDAERLWLESGPLRLSILRYRQGDARGEIWVGSVVPERARIGVVASRRPAPLRRVAPLPPDGRDALAINGGFYDRDDAPMGLVIAAGKPVHRQTRYGGSGIFAVENGVPSIHERRGFEATPATREALQSIDRLVANGAVLVKTRAKMPRDARSSLVIDGEGTLHLAVVFDDRAVVRREGERVVLGSRSSSSGPTLREWAEWLARPRVQGGLGARQALNLDGGFSTSMWARLEGRMLEVVAHQATINAVVVRPAPE